MDCKDFTSNSAGRCLKTINGYLTFIPNPLPPSLTYDEKLIGMLSRAHLLLGELSGTGRVLQNPYLLISPYMRREAVSSSKIEGTQSSLSDLFFYEAVPVKVPAVPDVKEVSNYVGALEAGIKLLDSLPVSTRLICDLHGILMKGVRGEHGTPGEMRTSQNWIGPPGCTLNEATFVPPPVNEMHAALSDWEKYVNSDLPEPVLLQTALLHYQFEAIHPFIDGNGRIGRLLITLFLVQKKALSQPLLYLSEFFDKYRDEYYAKLLAVSQRGDWRGWIDFFLSGVITQAEEALADSKKILDYHAECLQKVKNSKKVPESAYKILDEAFYVPVVNITGLSKKLDLPYNSVKKGVLRLSGLGILREATERRRNKLYIAPELIKLLIPSKDG